LKYVTIDVETTGLWPAANGIVQLGAHITDENGESVSTFERKCNPGMVDYSEQALAINGFTREQIKSFEPIDMSIRALAYWLKKNGRMHTVCHNAPFDVGFLRPAFAAAGEEDGPFRRVLCTVSIGFATFPDLGSYSLAALCKHLGIVQEGAHDALGDAKATSAVLHRCLRELRSRCQPSLFG
jgi:DNA polymerase III alpha subunit (gram-positive type)